MTFRDRTFGSLALASRSEAGWNADIVDGESDTGLFSSLVIDQTGRFHISYLRRTGTTTASVRYATIGLDDSAWDVRDVGTLSSFTSVFSGPRKPTSLAVDRDHNPWIAYSDEEAVNVAVWDGSSWQTQTVVRAADRTLGQLVSLKLDSQGHPHIVYYQITSRDPLTGVVKYAKGAP